MSSTLKEVDRSISAGEWDLAMQSLESLKGVQPEPEVYARLAHVLAVRGRFRSVIGTFLELAGVLLEKERFEDAERILHQVLTLRPESGEARERRIEIERKRGNMERAIELSRELARLCIEQGDGERSIRLLQAALGQQPDNLDIAQELAEMFVAHGHISEGAGAFRRVAAAFQARGDLGRAREAYRRLKVVQSDDCEVLLTLGRLHVALGEYEDAERELRSVLRHDLDHEQALLHLGWVCQLTGRCRSGILAFNKLLQNQPGHPVAHRKLAELHFSQGMMEEAVASFLGAAEGYIRAEAHDDAIACYRHVLAIEPGQLVAQQGLSHLGGQLQPLEVQLPGLAISSPGPERVESDLPKAAEVVAREESVPVEPEAAPPEPRAESLICQNISEPAPRPKLVRRGLIKAEFADKLPVPERKKAGHSPTGIRHGLVGKSLGGANPISEKPLLPSAKDRQTGLTSPRPEPISAQIEPPSMDLDCEELAEDFGSELFAPEPEGKASSKPELFNEPGDQSVSDAERTHVVHSDFSAEPHDEPITNLFESAALPLRSFEPESAEEPITNLFEFEPESAEEPIANLFEVEPESAEEPITNLFEVEPESAEEPITNLFEVEPESGEKPITNLFEFEPESAEEPITNLFEVEPESAEEPITNLFEVEPESGEKPITNLFEFEPESAEEPIANLFEVEPESAEEPITNLFEVEPESAEEPITNLFEFEPESGEEPITNLFDFEPETGEELVTNLFEVEPESAEEPVTNLFEVEPESAEEAVLSLFEVEPESGEELVTNLFEVESESAEEPIANLFESAALPLRSFEPEEVLEPGELAFEFPLDDDLFETAAESAQAQPAPVDLLSSEQRVQLEQTRAADDLEASLSSLDASTLMSAYRRALESTPDNAVIRTRLADLHLKYGLLDEAVHHYREVIALQPDAVPPLRRVIQAQLWNERYQQAGDSLLSLARLYQRHGQGDEALDTLQAVLTLDPCHCQALKEVAGIFASLTQKSLALHHLRQLAETALNQGDIASAVVAFHQLVDLSESCAPSTPADPAQAASRYVNLLLRRGQVAEAGRTLQRLERSGSEGAEIVAVIINAVKHEMDPHELALRFTYGELCLLAGHLDRAIEAFQQTRRHPDYERSSYNMLGQCFAGKAGFMMADLAVKQFRKGLELPGASPAEELELRYNLASVQYESGRAPEALAELEACAALDPDYRDVRGWLARLRAELTT